MNDPSLSERGPHDEAEELLPWYATGQLDAADRSRVERHLYSCGACRDQLAVERRLIGEFQTTTPEMESGWARIRARVAPPRPKPSAQPSFFGELRSLIGRPAVAALAAAQLAFVAVAGTTLWSLSRPDYHVLGSAPTPASANLIVIFRPEASEQQIRGALRTTDATIVGGPTAADAYLLHVDAQRRAAAIAQLQSGKLVQMAQPIDGAVQ